jgi:hypothetical protein
MMGCTYWMGLSADRIWENPYAGLMSNTRKNNLRMAVILNELAIILLISFGRTFVNRMQNKGI